MSKEERIQMWWIWLRSLTHCSDCHKGDIPYLNGQEYWHKYGACGDHNRFAEFISQLIGIY